MSDGEDRCVADLQQAGEALFDYAVDREDLKWLLARLPAAASVQPAKVEYELQLLKIISVGWCIVYYLRFQDVHVRPAMRSQVPSGCRAGAAVVGHAAVG